MKRSYEIIRKSTTFTQFGPGPDTLLSRHATYDAAKAAFDRAVGNIRLVEVSHDRRTVLDAALL